MRYRQRRLHHHLLREQCLVLVRGTLLLHLLRVLSSQVAAAVLGTLHMQAVLAVALLVVMVCRILANRIAVVWVARKVSATR